MVDRLPVWIFLSIAMLFIGTALLPLIRFLLGVDATIGIQFFTVVMLIIGGLMSGLSAMILLVRRQPNLEKYSAETDQKNIVPKLHATGLLIFTGIPLANFLVAYWLWIRHRHVCELIDKQGREVLNFQITIYLYLLLALFLVFAIIGIFFIVLLLLIQFVLTIAAIYSTITGKAFHYPVNIPIAQGRKPKESA